MNPNISEFRRIIQQRAAKKASHTRSFVLREWRLILLACTTIGLFFIGGILVWFATLDIPSLDSFHARKVAQSTKIYDRSNEVILFDVHGEVRRQLVDIEEVSRNMRNAILAIEDAEFYEHHGVKPKAIVRAVLSNILIYLHLSDGYKQGGSTITQQVVKNTLLTNERTITRKVKEWVLAIRLERMYSKDQILELYLNETPWGGTIYGIQEASLNFFGKSASDLSLAESAYLAAIPQAPTYYSPHGNHRDALESRKNLVLAKMLENKFITQEEYDAAKGEKVTFIEPKNTGIKAPHFVFFIQEYLEDKYGTEMVHEKGLKVITTLDYDLQQKAEDIVHRYALENKVRFNAENAALVAIDPLTGQILSMVGSRDYFDEQIDGKFNVATAYNRQPGSTFKPFVYATAFKKGYTPETVVFDLKTQFSTACAPDFLETSGECYSPDNYDGEFRGPITLRNALAQSLNVPAVKTLYLAGVNNALSTAHDMGITSLDKGRNYYGLPLVLGGGEVSLLEMTSAYGVFASEGTRNPPTGILKVETLDGEVLEEYKPHGTQALDPEITRQVSSILSDNNARTPAFGASSPLYFPGVDVAAKTGTTNDYRDVWVIGYTPKIVVGTWGGNNNNSPIGKQVAGFVLAPMWNEFMQYAIQKVPGGDFVDPAPLPETIPPVLRGVWNIGNEGVHDILYWVNKDDPRSGRSSYPASDPQFALWEYPVQLWAATNNVPGGSVLPSTVQDTQPSPITRTGPSFSITSPSNGSTVPANSLLTLSITHSNMDGVSKVSYYLDNAFIGASTAKPFSLSVFVKDAGTHHLRAVASGSAGEMSDDIQFAAR